MTVFVGLLCIILSTLIIIIQADTRLNNTSLEATGTFDWTVVNTSVWLSAASYCNTKDYLTRTYNGPSTGFKPVVAIDEKTYDTQGFVGYLSAQKKIYVVFRGSTSITDWLEDLSELLCSSDYCNGCSVHCGFQETEKKAFPLVLDAVLKVHSMFPDYSIVVTGHSLGAAVGTLVTLDLLASKLGVPISLHNFGCPRIGNTNFATFASNAISDKTRNTHYKDIVPHVPMHERYTHISGEWYEPVEVFDGHTIKECTGFEDPTCSYQWHVTSIDDHMHYLGLELSCDKV